MRMGRWLIPMAWLWGGFLALQGATNRASRTAPARQPAPGGDEPIALQDIRGPVDIPTVTPWIHRLLLTLAVLAILGLIWWALRRQARRREEFRQSAAARARARLAEAWAWVDQPERFCTRLSEVVRTYLEERFGLRAPEQTTEEFLAALPSSPDLDADLQGLLGEFLTQCDWVKFAQGDPGRAECERLHQMASGLIDRTGARGPVASGPAGRSDREGAP